MVEVARRWEDRGTAGRSWPPGRPGRAA